MKNTKVKLVPMEKNDRKQFVLDNQRAFKYGAIEEFGRRDEHFEEEGEIISRKTIEDSMDADYAEIYRIVADGKIVGGVIISINLNTNYNELVLFFVNPEVHSHGIGYAAWREIEKLHPETEVWETCTPYFETRNIHFYINKCGFHAVEFFNIHHPNSHMPDGDPDGNQEGDGDDMMFRFEKVMK
ncbi:MAG: GNAT family N-acetyltransferase [Oscillospiraceae bacterium]|nr:GNAT family N-acetyltransferase [Oscillospiraceae bacterium]